MTKNIVVTLKLWHCAHLKALKDKMACNTSRSLQSHKLLLHFLNCVLHEFVQLTFFYFGGFHIFCFCVGFNCICLVAVYIFFVSFTSGETRRTSILKHGRKATLLY